MRAGDNPTSIRSRRFRRACKLLAFLIRTEALRQIVICLGLAASVAGCTTLGEYVSNGFKVGPNYHRPPAPVASDWIDASDKRIRKDSDCDENRQWWAVFNDPVLTALVNRAYLENLTVRQAGFRVLEARAQLAIAVGAFFPQVQTMDGIYQRSQISQTTANRGFIGQRFFSTWTGEFNLAWEMDFWGRFRRSIENANDLLDASVDNYDDVLVTLVADVASTYVQMRTLEQRIELARQNSELQKKNYDIAEAKFKAGTTSKIDADQAAADLGQTEALIPTLQLALRQANDHLCVLLGIPPRDLTKELGSGKIPITPAEVAIGIPADLLTRRPDVRRAERQAAAQCALIGVADAEFYPAVSVTGTLGVQSAELAHLFLPRSGNSTIGPDFNWKILNYGRLAGNLALQDATFQELVAFYQNTVLRANSEVEDGLIAFFKFQEASKALARSAEAGADGVRLATVQYREGKIPFVALSTLQQQLVTQQDALAQAQGNIALGLIQVYRALGGGWQIRLSEPALPPTDAGTLPNPSPVLPNKEPVGPPKPDAMAPGEKK